MYELTDFCLDRVGSTCVTATNYGAKRTSDSSTYFTLFNDKAVDKAVETCWKLKYPMSNIY